MRKIHYKGNLKNDIENSKKEYSYFSDNKFMFLFDILLTFCVVILGYKISKDDINLYLLGFKIFVVSSFFTMVKAISCKKKIDRDRKSAKLRLSGLSKVLSTDKMNVSVTDLMSSSVTNAVIVDKYKSVKESVVSYHINSKNNKRLLIEMKDELAKNIASLRLRAVLLDNKDIEKDDIHKDTGLYLVENYEILDEQKSMSRVLVKKK